MHRQARRGRGRPRRHVGARSRLYSCVSMLACYYVSMSRFTVIPAIDVLEGRCVRLSEGRRERVTIEGGDPGGAAARFVAEGARFLHVVDLDGAFSGRPTPGLVEQIA